MALEDILPRNAMLPDSTSAFFVVVAVVAILSMVLIQMLKDMLPVRRWYQRRWMRDKLARLAHASRARLRMNPSLAQSVDPVKAEAQLITLATSGDAEAFYDLPIEQMCGQMNAALGVAIDHPTHDAELLLCFASGADAADTAVVFEQSRQSRETFENPPAPSQGFLDARNRVAHQVQRTIDGIQISAGFRWKWALQLVSILLSFGIAGWALSRESALVILTAGLLGGFFAPVFRDLLASLQTMRARR